MQQLYYVWRGFIECVMECKKVPLPAIDLEVISDENLRLARRRLLLIQCKCLGAALSVMLIIAWWSFSICNIADKIGIVEVPFWEPLNYGLPIAAINLIKAVIQFRQ